MIEPALMVVKVLYSVVLSLDIDDDVAFLQHFRVAGAGHRCIFVCGRETEEKDGECFVGMETATTQSLGSIYSRVVRYLCVPIPLVAEAPIIGFDIENSDAVLSKYSLTQEEGIPSGRGGVPGWL